MGDVKEILNKTCKMHMIIWRADTDGKIGRGGEADGTNTKINSARNIIGPYTTATTTETGNGAQIQIIYRKQENTHGDVGGNQGLKEEANPEKEIWDGNCTGARGEEKIHNNMDEAGWEIRRRIDYITISEKYRNAARTASNNPSWHADMNQGQQKSVRTTQL